MKAKDLLGMTSRQLQHVTNLGERAANMVAYRNCVSIRRVVCVMRIQGLAGPGIDYRFTPTALHTEHAYTIRPVDGWTIQAVKRDQTNFYRGDHFDTIVFVSERGKVKTLNSCSFSPDPYTCFHPGRINGLEVYTIERLV